MLWNVWLSQNVGCRRLDWNTNVKLQINLSVEKGIQPSILFLAIPVLKNYKTKNVFGTVLFN
jgi:hypothetical protein